MSTSARLFIDAAPELGEQAFKYTIDCKFATTRLWFSPGPIDLPEAHRVSICLQTHEDRCGKCRLDRLWRDHGSLEMKAEVDRLHEEIGRRMVARHLAERRN
jgi:hypothetical protein